MTAPLHQSGDAANAAKHVMDAASVGVVVATLFQWLPAIAALLTIVWTTIRIWETATMQKFAAWVRNKRKR